MNNIAILGTASDVGKSLCVAALCRIFARLGYDVAPFKAQNMSNNSYVTTEGGEMGRAQVVQAQAARLTPSIHMNPVLLKPSADISAQVILRGKVLGNREAGEYFADTATIRSQAYESLKNLQIKHDLIIIEGTGSCAELNLRDRDFVNFDTAHEADADVYIIADINRGGVFAQIIGTMEILSPKDKSRVKGFIINQFRGDIKLFEDGIKLIEERTQLPILGVIPYCRELNIDCEDSLSQQVIIDPVEMPKKKLVRVAVLLFPHLSNFTDFRVFEKDPQIELHYLSKTRNLDSYDLVILPGSKNVRRDAVFARTWLTELRKFKGILFGICGGLQILGESISDPCGVEGEVGCSQGLGLIPLITELGIKKITRQITFREELFGTQVKGYEIHHGISKSMKDINYFSIHTKDGIILDNIFATYLHGVFDEGQFREKLLQSINIKYSLPNIEEDPLDKLADHFEGHLNMSLFN